MTTYELLKWANEAIVEMDGSWTPNIDGEPGTSGFKKNMDECIKITKPANADHIECAIVEAMVSYHSCEDIHDWYMEYKS